MYANILTNYIMHSYIHSVNSYIHTVPTYIHKYTQIHTLIHTCPTITFGCVAMVFLT